LDRALIQINLGWGNDINFDLIINFSFVFFSEYLYGGVKIVHGDEPSFIGRWNPAAQTNVHIFASHHLAYNEKERETTYYNCDEFIQSLDIGKKKQIFCFYLYTKNKFRLFLSFKCISTRKK